MNCSSPGADLLRRILCRAALLAFGLVGAAMPLRADPTPSFDQIYVRDEGAKIEVSWRFFYKLLPPKFILRKKNGQAITLDDPATLRQNLFALASVAFDVSLDGRPSAMTQSPELSIAPNGSVLVSMLYPGRRGGRLEFRDRMLPYYPPTYVINYQIYSPLDPAGVVSGYFTGGASPIIGYTQLSADFRPSIFDWLNSPPVRLFKAELRTAWINTNLLFMAILLVLMRPMREVYSLAWTVTGSWFLPCFLWVKDGLQVPFSIHPLVPALLTVAICVLCLRSGTSFQVLACVLVAGGIVNGCFDVQQTSIERPAPELANVLGVGLGFIIGFALVFAVAVPIVLECRKHAEFQRAWAPKICWLLAALALVLPEIRA